jgi:C-terminal processing protease CtpA/Prc
MGGQVVKKQKRTIKAKLQKKKQNDKKGKSKHKEKRIFVINQFVQDNIDKKKKGPKKTKKDCKSFYTGIGITTSWSDHITYVAPGGPADIAGIRKGDQLLDPAQRIRDKFKEGTLITVTVIRDGITKDITVRIDKICMTEMETP